MTQGQLESFADSPSFGRPRKQVAFKIIACAAPGSVARCNQKHA
jgi:hypothetical protein